MKHSTALKRTGLFAALLLMGSGTAQAAAARTPGQYALGNGLTLSANYTGEAAANTTGGLRQGSAY
ncbi:MAG: carbohydrate porin, partial [Thiomonas sp.]